MFRYYAWALSEKTFSYVPFGRRLALATCDWMTKDRGSCQSFTTTFRVVRKVGESTPPNGKILDVGTGWFHHDAFLIYLLPGPYTVYLCDIEDRANLRAIHNYLENLVVNRDRVCAELGISVDAFDRKIRPLLALNTREEIYRQCNFVPCIVPHPERLFLPRESIDFVVGSCVLNHIRPDLLSLEVRNLREILKPDGYMFFLIGHEDHWSFHDSSANPFNYYRYSDVYYRRFFETEFEYHNRMVKEEWFELFRDIPLSVREYSANITDQTRSAIERLPHIDARFARFPREDLAIAHSYFLLAK